MTESVRSVTMTLKTQADANAAASFDRLARSAGNVSKSVKEADVSMRQMAVGASTEVRKLDRGVSQLAHGFGGLTQNLFMTSTMLAGAGGHAGKFAEHAQKAAGAMMLIHSAALSFRGVVAIANGAGAAMASYVSTTMMAAAANRTLAQSHIQVAEAALAQAGAENAAGSASVLSAGVGRLTRGMGIGIGLGGAAGGLAAAGMGYGTTGQIAGVIGGSALGGAAARYGPALASGAVRGGVSALGGLGAAAGVGAGTAGIIALGLLALPDAVRTATGAGGGMQNTFAYRHTPDFFATPFASGGKELEAAEARSRMRESMREAREVGFSVPYQAQTPFLERQRALGISSAGFQDQYQLQIGAGGATHALAQQVQASGMQALAASGNITSLKNLPGYEMHQADLGRQIQDLAKGTASGMVQSGIGVEAADRERARAAAEVATKEKDIAAWKANAARTDAEGAVLTQQLAQAQDRLLASDEKRLEALKAQGKVQQENGQAWAGLAREQAQYYRGLAQAEKDRQKSGKEEFALMDPSRRRALIETANKLADLDEGRAKAGPAQWAIVNGRPQQVGGGTGLTDDQLQMAKSNPLLRDQLNSVAAKSLTGDENAAWSRLVKRSGAEQKSADLAGQAAMFEKMEMTINNNVQVQLDLKSQNLADEVAKALVPIVNNAINSARVGGEMAVDAAQKAASANRRASAGSQGGS